MSTPATSTAGFQATQRAFASYIREPKRNPLPPGVAERRMRVYAQLFYNNVERFLAETFSVFREITPDADWHALARDFLHRHRATSPYFSQIPEEFLEYLGNADDSARPAVPPFALELCHYEWVRLALRLAADADCVHDDVPLTVADAVVVSPLAWPLRYAYPVHRINADHQPDAPPPQPTFLIAHRDRKDRVSFLTSTATTLRLLQLIGEERPLRDCFATLASESGGQSDELTRSGLAALNDLHERDIVLRKSPLGEGTMLCKSLPPGMSK